MPINVNEGVPADGLASLYERDYYGWIQRNVRAIREGRVHEVDWANVAEELEDMGKSERRALRSQLARLMSQLLKWSYQPERRRISEHSWRATIEHARQSISELLSGKPKLQTATASTASTGVQRRGSRSSGADQSSEADIPRRLSVDFQPNDGGGFLARAVDIAASGKG